MTSIDVRFWRKVQIGGQQECWVWKGEMSLDGYGMFSYGRDLRVRAHRFAWMLSFGEPEGVIHHDCGERLCCNVAHMQDLSPEEHDKLHWRTTWAGRRAAPVAVLLGAPEPRENRGGLGPAPRPGRRRAVRREFRE